MARKYGTVTKNNIEQITLLESETVIWIESYRKFFRLHTELQADTDANSINYKNFTMLA